MRNIFLDKPIFDDQLETTKETIKIKIDWQDYNLFFDYIDNYNSKEIGFELPNNLIENIDGDVYINIPIGFAGNINGFPFINKSKLSFGDIAIINKDNISIEIERTNAGRKFAAPLIEETNKFIYAGLSGVVHILAIATLAMFVPALGLTDNEDINKDSLFLMQQYLKASAEREQEARPTEEVSTDKVDDKEGGTGKRAMGEEGAMGNPTSRDTNKRFAIAGPKDNQDVHIARENALRDASRFGMIGLLNTASGDINSPTAPWGRDDALGNDAISARGNMWGNEIGESFGAGGLSLSGIGEGGGSFSGIGIGLGNIGTIGRGAGNGGHMGFGNGNGRLNGGHKVKSPVVRYGTTSINGRIDPAVLQRIVRQNFGKFKFCYEVVLKINPSLQGRVVVRFIINRDGSVANATGVSDVSEANFLPCIMRAFYGLSFPNSDSVITVSYPIIFSPK